MKETLREIFREFSPWHDFDNITYRRQLGKDLSLQEVWDASIGNMKNIILPLGKHFARGVMVGGAVAGTCALATGNLSRQEVLALAAFTGLLDILVFLHRAGFRYLAAQLSHNTP